jgi:hypothetical protein
MANLKISELITATEVAGTEYAEIIQNGVNKKALTSLFGITREFNRTFSETLVFDKHEIFHTPTVMTDDIALTIGDSGLVDQSSAMRFRITTDGIHSISFGAGFDYLYGISNGQILDAGTYEVYLIYTNGSVSVSVPGVSSESSSTVTLSAPSNFTAVADGENDIDLSWDDVSNESSYLIEFSLTGSGGWSTLATPAANVTTSTQSGLGSGDIRYYRIKSIGDGVNFGDSAYSSVISGQTESSGDVTAPTFIFLPASGNVVWTVNRPITITANEPIRNTDGSEITNLNVAALLVLKETNSGGTNIAFTATIDSAKQIIIVTPTVQYGENQLVYVAINNVEDVNGNEVTVAISSTFTTTDYTFFNGSSNALIFGDILDSAFAATDTNFWLELTVKDILLSGTRRFISKNDAPGNQRGFSFHYTNTDVYFFWVRTGDTLSTRLVKWTGVLTAGEHILVLKYDGSIDTGNGLDRCTLLIDGVIAGSKTLDSAGSALGAIFSNTAQLAVSADVNSAGTPLTSAWISGEAKDFIVRSTAGSTVEINVPNLKTGVDTSGNGRNGTWV